jgi:signal transduction histidine kinase
VVWDTGIGIPEEEFENIFLPFYQVEPSLTREHEGIGLGLSIAKGMVELCRGRIWVESEPGQGSRFTFTVPKQGTAEAVSHVPIGPSPDG